MDGMGLIIFGGIGLLVVGGIAVSSWSQKKRKEAWQRVAEELGLPFVDKNNDVLGKCAAMKVFQRGSGRRFYNALEGDAGDTKITIGDYRFTTGSGKNRTTHVQTRCVLQSATMQVAHCYLRPENAIFDKLGAMMGGQDINFADDPEFSGGYVLQGDHEPAVRNLFDDHVRAWFAERRGRRFHFEANGDRLVFHYGKKRKPEEAGQMMQEALEIMSLLGSQSRS
jgi:hypothetical protein